MSALIIPAQPEHVELIAGDARQADIDELWASCEITPEAALWKGLYLSTHAWTGFANGDAVCMFGATPSSLVSGRGYAWMVGTNALDRHAREFLINCKPQIQRMKSMYNLLENHIDARNTRAIRWLRWLGFTIHEQRPFGPHGAMFHYFSMECG